MRLLIISCLLVLFITAQSAFSEERGIECDTLDHKLVMNVIIYGSDSSVMNAKINESIDEIRKITDTSLTCFNAYQHILPGDYILTNGFESERIIVIKGDEQTLYDIKTTIVSTQLTDIDIIDINLEKIDKMERFLIVLIPFFIFGLFLTIMFLKNNHKNKLKKLLNLFYS